MFIIVHRKTDKYMIYSIIYSRPKPSKLKYVCSSFAETYECVKTIYYKEERLKAFIKEVLKK